MKITKPRIERNFTMIPNSIFRTKRLSLKAIGLYCLLWWLKPNWNFTKVGLESLVSDKRTSIGRALNELIENGWIIITPNENDEEAPECVQLCVKPEAKPAHPSTFKKDSKKHCSKKSCRKSTVENQPQYKTKTNTKLKTTTHAVVEQPETPRSLDDNIKEIFKDIDLSDSEIALIYNASGKDPDRCQRAVDAFCKRTTPVRKLIAWFIDQVKHDYAPDRAGYPPTKRNSFTSFQHQGNVDYTDLLNRIAVNRPNNTIPDDFDGIKETTSWDSGTSFSIYTPKEGIS